MLGALNVSLQLLLVVALFSLVSGGDGKNRVRISRQSDFDRALGSSKSPGNNNNNSPQGSNGGFGGGFPPQYPNSFNYNHNPYGGYSGPQPPFNPYQSYNFPYQFPFNNRGNFNGNYPSSAGQVNINLPAQTAPAAATPNNINNVIYGPAPPSNVNNNFYGPSVPAAAPPPVEKNKDKFCNANTEFNCYNGMCLSDPHQLCDGKNDCGNRVDEMSCPHLNYQIRLRSENDESDTQAQYANSFNEPQLVNRFEGIIEVSVKGQRGCVCNRNFDIHDADVACRELGFRKGCDKLNRVSRTRASELYSDGVPYLMDNVNCIGNETSMQECDFDGWGRADRSCGRRNIVSISCRTDQRQLLPPPPTLAQNQKGASRFNVYNDMENNSFHTPTPVPPVVSRFGDDTPTPPQYYPQHPQFHQSPPQIPSNPAFNSFNRTSVIHRDETQITEQNGGASPVSCLDNQFQCKSNNKCIPIDRICDRYSDCEDNSDETFEGCNQPIQVRLSSGQAVSEGRLEIRVHGIWGTVCDKSFALNEAGVFCRSLGFLGQPEIVKGSGIAEGKGPIWLDNLVCPADDTCCLTSCHNLAWGRSSCTHSQDVVLRCSNLLKRSY